MENMRPELKHEKLTVELDHNPYEIRLFNFNTNKSKQVVVFPIFHYEGTRQYYDLIAPVIKKGYKVISITLITKEDRVLFLGYYFQIFSRIVHELYRIKVLSKEHLLTLMGFGVGGYIVAYNQINHLVDCEKLILISPVNHYHDEFLLNRFIDQVTVPTFIHYGQSDTLSDEDVKYRMFERGKNNPLVHFSCYPICGQYLYYKDILSMRLEKTYRNNYYDLYIGDDNRFRTSALPERVVLNELFFKHLFNELDDIPNKKRICLLTDVFPLFVNGVNIVVDLLKKELISRGYEVYTAALWDKKLSFKKLPDDYYIPIKANYAYFLRGHRELEMFEAFNFTRQAKALSVFGFDYLHLHTEYTMGQIAIKLAKYTGIKLLYTYHTLWNLYYQHKFGKLVGDITFKAAKRLLFTHVYKSCEIITVPSKKTYDVLKDEANTSNIRIIPSAINLERFKLVDGDQQIIEELKDKYNLRKRKVLGYVGRVSLEKNIIETLENISRIKDKIPNIVFMVIGAGDAINPLRKAAEKYQLTDNIIFVGEVENAKLKYYYALFDVFVTASNFETQGSTYFEAANCGTLILAKEDKSLEGVFIDGKNAYLYDGFYSWLERLEKALFSDNLAITTEAKANMKQYSKDKWAKKMLALYTELNPVQK